MDTFWLGLQILLILLAAFVLQRIVARGLTRLGERYPLPHELLVPVRGGLRWLIMGSGLLFVLERRVSATVLWTALSGFVAVAAVAFFAMWSVLSNLLCAVLIFTVGPFRIGDVVELVDTTDKPGVKGRVIAINLLYTTLMETPKRAVRWCRCPTASSSRKPCGVGVGSRPPRWSSLTRSKPTGLSACAAFQGPIAGKLNWPNDFGHLLRAL
jgi:small-conductance mechanosensitive channel